MSQFGRSQLFPNIVASGAAYLVAVVIGFIMPRVIYESVGPVALGLWDLGWSFLAYISFSGLGLGSAIAHYLSVQISRTERTAAFQTCTSGFLGQLVFGILLGALFIAGFSVISAYANLDSSEASNLLYRMGLYIGLAVAFVIVGDVAQGILLACHKSRIGELINMAHDLALAVCMVIVLVWGYGVVELAMVTALLRFFSECTRFFFAFKVYEHLSFAPRDFSANVLAMLIRYGIKSSIAAIQEILVFQSVRLVLFFSMGPIALAAFSRYATIARQINRLTERLSISIPTIASGYAAEGQSHKIKSLYLNGVQGGMLLTLPVLSVFCVFGDAIVEIWMGREFVIPNLAWIFAGSCLFHANFSLCNRTLSGINAHGRIALFCLALSGTALMALCIYFYPFTSKQSAGLILIVMMLTVQVPHIVFANYRFSVSFYDLVKHAYAKPVLANAIFLAILYSASTLFGLGEPFLSYLVALVAFTSLTLIYWIFVITSKTKLALKEFVLNGPH